MGEAVFQEGLLLVLGIMGWCKRVSAGMKCEGRKAQIVKGAIQSIRTHSQLALTLRSTYLLVKTLWLHRRELQHGGRR